VCALDGEPREQCDGRGRERGEQRPAGQKSYELTAAGREELGAWWHAVPVDDEPVAAITPGQSLVVYDGARVLGGGIIDRAARASSRTGLPVLAA
jgi:DNA-binding PadR family transcriptional regulator